MRVEWLLPYIPTCHRVSFKFILMRFVALVCIFTVWGCSDDSHDSEKPHKAANSGQIRNSHQSGKLPRSGSCPKAVLTVLEKVLDEGKVDLREIIYVLGALKNGASQEDVNACMNAILEDKRAWNFVHKQDGASKKAEFEGLPAGAKQDATLQFFAEFYMEAFGRVQFQNPPPNKQNIIKLN